MPQLAPARGNVISFARHWHVILEIDLVAMLADHGARRKACARIEALADALTPLPPPALAKALSRDLARCAGDRNDLETLFGAERDSPAAAIVARSRRRDAALRAEATALSARLVSRSPGLGRGTDAKLLRPLLRAYARDCRAAMECAELAVLALGGKRLAPRARALLLETLAAPATIARPIDTDTDTEILYKETSDA